MRRTLSVACVIGVAALGCGGDKFVGGDASAGDAAADSASGDGGDGGRPVTIGCHRSVDCAIATQACCLFPMGANDQCIPRPTTPTIQCPGFAGQETTLVMCDDSSQCPNNLVCCSAKQSNSFSASCGLASQCNNGGDRLILCEPSIAKCPQGTTCQPHPVVNTFFACQ